MNGGSRIKLIQLNLYANLESKIKDRFYYVNISKGESIQLWKVVIKRREDNLGVFYYAREKNRWWINVESSPPQLGMVQYIDCY